MNVKKENNYNLTFIAIGFYLALQIFSDIGSLKIIKLFGFSIDGGTFLYPFTFTIRDLIHRLSNKKTSQIVIIQSGFLNLFMALFFYIIGRNLPLGFSFKTSNSSIKLFLISYR